MIDSWLPPDGVRRISDVITVSVGMFKGGDFRCPAADALKARGYRPIRSVEQPPELLEHFTFGPFMAACDARACDGEWPFETDAGTRRPLHDGLRQWSAHGLASYRDAFPADSAEPLLHEAEEPWIYRHRPGDDDPWQAREYRLTVWGRRLRSADGKVRELRLPVNKLRKENPPESFVAAAALVLAEGGTGPLPERVRIVEFALLGGPPRTLFDGTSEEARTLYRTKGRAALASVLDGQEYRPGSSCAECPFLAVCPALRRAPELLGVESAGRPRRSWSVTNGRNYRICPARDHMRRLHLPTADAVEHGPTAERGRALHAYLARCHGAGAARPCTVDIPEAWVPPGYDLPADERALGARLLRHHAAVCPLRLTRDGADVRTEPRVVRHDTKADVIVIAAPDLLYRDAGSWVWRETKTSSYRSGSNRPLLERYPQLALATLLLARGDLGGSSDRARIELEVLRPGGADLEVIDPFAAATRATAERIVQDLVDGWLQDDRYPARPGRACGSCEMAHWCSKSAIGQTA
ncbi:PD-(D/E)XK nuclease family protein [Kitasatospora sp. NPDC088134]|uniref:PD-(D/E)XK nuclease family protein n=1 Tax=Kitasatospora sp. NPDC088134 TaxID=3364071 RepID=UPI00381A986F